MKNPLYSIKVLYNHGLFGWNYAYLLAHPWKLVEESYYHVKWFIQRGHRGYADCDVWGIEYYITKWLPMALQELRENTHGHPIGTTKGGWNTRLNLMIDGFVAAREIQDMKHKYKSVEERAAWRRFRGGMKVFNAHFFSLWN